MREAELAVGFNALLALLDVACLALTKASMLDSRYFLIVVPVINSFMMMGTHALLKSFEPLQIYAGVSEPCRHRDDAGGCVGHHPGASEGLV